MKKGKSLFLILWCLFHAFISAAQINLTVAQDGSGDYRTVQAAINAAPAGRTTPYVIFIKNGTYKEKINIPSSKPFLKLIGETVAHVILTYNDYAAKNISCTNTLGTQNSASFTVNAADFTAENITFINSYGEGSQAVAMLCNADRMVFVNCRFLGNQDTIYLKGGGTPRNYFRNCYIDGNIDFIFGNAVALFDSCVVYAKSRSTNGTSYITAPNTPVGQSYGFVFRNAQLPVNTGATQYYLSRPWPSPDAANTRQNVVFLSAKMSTHIRPEGWSVWDANTITANLNYGEYKSRYFNGGLVDVSQRVSWSRQLTDADTAQYGLSNVLGTWNPCGLVPEACNPQIVPMAISNAKAVKGVNSCALSWNISWPVSGIQYTVLRSTDRINYSAIHNTTESSDSIIYKSYTDMSIPSSGTSYYYLIVASAPGMPSVQSDTLIVSSMPTILTNAPQTLQYCGFSQLLGTPSASQSATCSATDLTSPLVVTPSFPFEVSSDNVNWYTNSNPLVIQPVGGNLATSNLYVRLNANVTGNFTGIIMQTSTGADTVRFNVTGTTFGASTSASLQTWPMTSNNQDSAAIRSSYVLSSESLVSTTQNKLYTSDGTTPAANPIPAYSGQYGQALGANTAGNNWTNVGGTLNRNYYEQFVVKTAPGKQIRVDSITFYSDFYQTSSNIKMAVVYSKNGFSSPADSMDISGVTGPGNIALSFATSGTFTKSFAIQRNDAGPVNRYAVALNGVDGVTLQSDQSLYIRLYWACGSTGTPRFAFLKNVQIMGVEVNALPVKLIEFNATYLKENKASLFWKTTDETNVKKYEIESSEDGINFRKVAEIASKGDGSNHYKIELEQISSIRFYRVKLINGNDLFSYTSTKIVVRPVDAGITIQPNPATNTINISYNHEASAGLLSIYDLNGKLVMKQTVLPNTTSLDLNIHGLNTGEYLLVIQQGKKISTKAFFKK